MRTTTLHKSKSRNGKPSLLPLRNGDHLSRTEFERRWDATPDLRHAELIEGIVFMSPPTTELHSEHHDVLHHLLSVYARATPGVKSRIAPSLRLDNRNEFQPDCVLRIEAPKVGKSWISTDNYLEGAPELVAEIAVSSADYDAHEKRSVYERIGVSEYLLWQVLDARLDWCQLQDGKFVPLKPRADGVVCSVVLPGFWLDVRALLAGDETKVTKVLGRGLRSAEHGTFLRRLLVK